MLELSGVCTPPQFVLMVRGIIFRALLCRAPCWASVLCLSRHIAQLDAILVLACQLAFGLEWTTLSKACRALVGLFSACQYIMQSIVGYLQCQHRSALQTTSFPHMLKHYIIPQELGKAWFIQAIRGHKLITLIPQRSRSIYEGVDRTLTLELQQRQAVLDHGKMLYENSLRVGMEWHPWDIDQVPLRGVTLVPRFLTRHCHLGFFFIPRTCWRAYLAHFHRSIYCNVMIWLADINCLMQCPGRHVCWPLDVGQNWGFTYLYRRCTLYIITIPWISYAVVIML